MEYNALQRRAKELGIRTDQRSEVLRTAIARVEKSDLQIADVETYEQFIEQHDADIHRFIVENWNVIPDFSLSAVTAFHARSAESKWLNIYSELSNVAMADRSLNYLNTEYAQVEYYLTTNDARQFVDAFPTLLWLNLLTASGGIETGFRLVIYAGRLSFIEQSLALLPSEFRAAAAQRVWIAKLRTNILLTIQRIKDAEILYARYGEQDSLDYSPFLIDPYIRPVDWDRVPRYWFMVHKPLTWWITLFDKHSIDSYTINYVLTKAAAEGTISSMKRRGYLTTLSNVIRYDIFGATGILLTYRKDFDLADISTKNLDFFDPRSVEMFEFLDKSGVKFSPNARWFKQWVYSGEMNNETIPYIAQRFKQEWEANAVLILKELPDRLGEHLVSLLRIIIQYLPRNVFPLIYDTIARLSNRWPVDQEDLERLRLSLA